jgi:hypothetical protein
VQKRSRALLFLVVFVWWLKSARVLEECAAGAEKQRIRNSWKSVAIFPQNNSLYKEEVKEEEEREEWYSTNEKRKTRRIERKSTTTFPT